MNRDFQAAMDEKEPICDDATVRREEHIRLALIYWHVPIRRRSIRVKRRNPVVVLSAMYTTVPRHGDLV